MSRLKVDLDKNSTPSNVKAPRQIKIGRDAPGLFFEGPPKSFDGDYIEVRKRKEREKDPFETQEFIGLTFHVATIAALLDELVKRVGNRTFSYLVTPNVDHLVTVKRNIDDEALQLAYQESDLLVCDSRILSLLARLSKITLPAVPGSDVTGRMLERLPHRTSIAVVGGCDQVQDYLRLTYSQFDWQFFCPPMGVRQSERLQDDVVNFVCRAQPDITFLAIGAPQSELVCHKLKQSGRAKGLALCIGASLEFITGQKKRAPIWMQRASLEWLHRLCSEPHRLAYRYLIKGPTIFIAWAKWVKRQAE